MYIQCLSLRGAPPQVPALSIPQTGTGHDKWRVFVFISSFCKCFLLCWFWNFFLKSLCRSMLYLYRTWSSDVYNIIELFFVRVHTTCFFERSASTSAHSVNTTDRQRPWQWRVFVCVCVCHHVECVFFVLLILEFLFEKSMQNNDLLYGAATIVV